MNRFGAFAVHLGISLIIFVILGYLILFHWYPDFFFASDGGWQGIRIVAFVDLVLGPTLTLVVFNPAKPGKELKRDLSIIGMIQMVCLTAGVWVVYSERPIAMVFSDGAFNSMSADDYLDLGLPVPELDDMVGPKPNWVSVKLPEDPIAQSAIRRRALESKIPVRTLADYYEPFDISHIDFDTDGYRAEDLRTSPDLKSLLEQFEKEHGAAEQWNFIRFGTRYSFALLAAQPGNPRLHYLELPPPQEKPSGGG